VFRRKLFRVRCNLECEPNEIVISNFLAFRCYIMRNCVIHKSSDIIRLINCRTLQWNGHISGTETQVMLTKLWYVSILNTCRSEVRINGGMELNWRSGIKLFEMNYITVFSRFTGRDNWSLLWPTGFEGVFGTWRRSECKTIHQSWQGLLPALYNRWVWLIFNNL
jgi:hypothetical protein